MDMKYHDLEKELVEALALAALDEYEQSNAAEEDTSTSANEENAFSREPDQRQRQQEKDNETEAIKRNVISYFQRLVALVQNVPEGVAAATLNLEEPRQVVYIIATFLQMELELRQKLLELDSVQAKLQELSNFLRHE